MLWLFWCHCVFVPSSPAVLVCPNTRGGSYASTNFSSRLSHTRRSLALSPHLSPAIAVMWRSVSRLLLNLAACLAPCSVGSCCCRHHHLHPSPHEHLVCDIPRPGNVPPDPPDHAQYVRGPSLHFVFLQVHSGSRPPPIMFRTCCSCCVFAALSRVLWTGHVSAAHSALCLTRTLCSCSRRLRAVFAVSMSLFFPHAFLALVPISAASCGGPP